ncbi:MAG: flavin monoamine oxidase family protein [Methylovulum sp.]
MARTPFFRKFVLALQTARRENLQEQDLPEPIPYSMSGWTRRKFMKTTLAAGAAGLAGSCLSTLAIASGGGATTPRVAIIGAGMAGLNAAYQLKKAGINATVYEARSRIGGRMLSAVFSDGLVVDLGAELINTDHADMLSLVKEFNISLFNKLNDAKSQLFPKEAYFFDGVSYSESQLADDLRLIAKQISTDAKLLDQDWDTNAPIFDQLSVADYLDRHADKITRSYVRTLFENAIRTEYGAEPSESSALQLLFMLPEVKGQSVELLSYSDEAFSVVGGAAEITNALGDALDGQIQLNKTLQEINAVGSEYQLTFSDRSVVNTDMVIITVPFAVLSKVVINAPLPALLRRFINETELGSNEKLIGSFSNRFWRQANGFSLAAWTDLGFAEVWDETQRQSERNDGALNFFLGGDQARQLAKINNVTSIGNQFVSALDRFIPGASQAASGTFIKSGWTKSPQTLGGYANFKPGQLTTFGEYFWIESPNFHERQEVSAGNIIFAGEHTSDEYYGFMNGSAQTGRLAAGLVVKRVSAQTV